MAGSAHANDAPRWRRSLRHALCIVALMWVALVNGQPFFFPDTTSYVRAADLAMFLTSDGRISTDWTARYVDGLPSRTISATKKSPDSPLAGNDIGAGNIMAGRSPYIGAALYLAYVLSDFWFFVIGQAAICYGLIVLTLRRFKLDDDRAIVGVVLFLSATTSLPFFNSLLLADALASFGVLAYLLIATDRGMLSRRSTIFLGFVLLASVMSHMTHIVMLMGMIGVLVALRLFQGLRPSRLAMTIGAGCVLAGFASLSLTSFAIQTVFNKPPQLVPLLTARFLADGPGTAFIRSGCGGQDFLICHLPIREKSSTDFLWSTDPAHGVFLTASPEQRARLSAEDTRFALAVWKAYPVQQTGMIVYNSVKQLLVFPYDGLNEGCFSLPNCWASLPPHTRDQLRRSVGGRNLWPRNAMTALLYAVVALSTTAIAIRLTAVRRKFPEEGSELATWILLAGTAMLICAILGGAVSEPQYRYQGRLIWLIPLFASIIVLLEWRNRSVAPAPPIRRDS